MENVKKSEKQVQKNHNRNEINRKNRFEIEGNSLFGSEIGESSIFDEDNKISPDYSVLTINIDRATLREASNFKRFIENAISRYERNIIVDLNNCEFVDSSFFGVLVGGVKRLKTKL